MNATRSWLPYVGFFGMQASLANPAGAAEIEYQLLSLPGFTVEVPKGQLIKNVSTPQVGAYEWAYLPAGRRDKHAPPSDSVFKLNVSWIAAGMLRADWIRYVAPAIDSQGAFSGTELGSERDIGKDRWLGVRREPAMELDRPFTAIGLIECNARFSVTIRFSFHENAAAQAAATERIVNSVKCDPATAQLKAPEAVLALPAVFKRVNDTSMQKYAAPDGRTIGVTFLPQDMVRSRRSLVPALQMQLSDHFDFELGEDGFHGLNASEQGLERLRNALFQIDEGKLAGSFVRVRYCEGPQLTFFAILQGSPGAKVDENAARTLLDKVGCPGH